MSAPTHPTPSQPPQPTQQPPAWQPPPPELGQATNPTPPPRPKRRRRRTVLVAVGVGLVLAIAAVGVTGCGTGQKAAATEDAPATTEAPAPADPGEEGIPDEGIPEDVPEEEPEPVEPVSKQIGETLTLTDVDTDEDVAKVWITKVESSRGGEFDEPEHGNYLGVYVKVKALTDDQSSLWGDFYVVQKNHHYDADGCCPERFEPTLDYVDLNEGEWPRAGWYSTSRPPRRDRPGPVLRRRQDRHLVLLRDRQCSSAAPEVPLGGRWCVRAIRPRSRPGTPGSARAWPGACPGPARRAAGWSGWPGPPAARRAVAGRARRAA